MVNVNVHLNKWEEQWLKLLDCLENNEKSNVILNGDFSGRVAEQQLLDGEITKFKTQLSSF